MKKNLLNELKTAIIIGISLIIPPMINCSATSSYKEKTKKNIYQTILPNEIKPIKEKIIDSSDLGDVDFLKMIPEQAIKFVKTPQQAEDYNHFHFSFDTERSFKNNSFVENYKDKKGNCIDYATNIAALLSDNNYPPYILFMRGEKDSDAVFLYKNKKGFAIKDTTLGLFGNSHNTIEDLIGNYNLYKGKNYDSYFIADLDKTFPNKEWIFGNKFFNPLFKDLDSQRWNTLKKKESTRGNKEKKYTYNFYRDKKPKFPGRILTKRELE